MCIIDVAAANPIGTLIVGGLSNGVLYALLVVGVVLVYQVGAAVNFAYGQFGAIAALVTVQVSVAGHLPLGIGVAIGIAVGAALAAATQISLFERLGVVGSSGRDLLVGLGLLLSLVSLTETVFGVSSTRIPGLGADRTFVLGGAVLSVGDVIDIAVGAILVVGVYWWLYRTSIGLRIRATALRTDVAEGVGINTRALKVVVWAVAGAYCAVAAVLFANQLSASADFMTDIIITVFVLALLGGPERYWIPVIVSVAYGMFFSVVEYIFGANAGTPATFVVAVLVLMVLPKRLVGRAEAERA